MKKERKKDTLRSDRSPGGWKEAQLRAVGKRLRQSRPYHLMPSKESRGVWGGLKPNGGSQETESPAAFCANPPCASLELKARGEDFPGCHRDGHLHLLLKQHAQVQVHPKVQVCAP